LRTYLEGLGIEAGVHYPSAVHQQPAYRPLLEAGTSLPRTEAIVPEILSLPIYPEIIDEQVDEVIAGLRSWTGSK
jgi:dTDP-4-amino-4,6-dideoxygalactose transaminase